MCELNRYFIELQPSDGLAVPRYREAEVRRQQAADFLERVEAWLRLHELDSKVSTMAITALGQVQITCEADVINQLRNYDDMAIAAIRSSTMMSDLQNRWSNAQ
ncbi:MAG TPA: hypothetical protein VFR09_06390 [Alphaproteobacteria bacterium]|nr:hypothetical protein [Alphaproteobacteria bacterium]